MKALIVKELRENLKWLAVGLAIFVCLGFYSIPYRYIVSSSFMTRGLEHDLVSKFGAIGGLLAFALGVIQSAFDLRSGNRAYLQHRGVSSLQIVIAKVLSGFLIYALALSVPLAGLATYFGWIGLEYYPMRPGQVFPAWILGLMVFIMHPTAMIVMARPARWWGTRLLPFFFGVVFWVFLTGTNHSVTLNSFVNPWLFFIYCFAVPLVCWGVIDAWDRQSLNPVGGRAEFVGWRMLLIILVSSTVAVSAILAVNVGFLEMASYSKAKDYDLKVDFKTGELWAVSKRPEHRVDLDKLYGAKIEVDNEPTEFQLLDKKQTLLTIAGQWRMPPGKLFFSGSNPNGSDRSYHEFINDERGYLLRYDVSQRMNPRLDAIIDSTGVHSPASLPSNRFDGLQSLWSQDFGAIFDKHGLYYLAYPDATSEKFQLRKLLDREISQAWLASYESRANLKLVVLHQDELTEFELFDRLGAELTSWMLKEDGRTEQQRYDDIQELEARLTKTIKLPPELIGKELSPLLMRYETGYIANHQRNHQRLFRLDFDEPARELPKFAFEEFSMGSGLYPAGGIPLVVWAFGSGYGYATASSAEEFWEDTAVTPLSPNSIGTLLPMAFLFVVVSALIVFWMLRYRAVGRTSLGLWMLACIPFGLATPLAIAALYPRRIEEKCWKCGRMRRVDLNNCEHCKSSWPELESQGIEIFDHHRQAAVIEV
jgi:hypothetical protein